MRLGVGGNEHKNGVINFCKCIPFVVALYFGYSYLVYSDFVYHI